MDYRKVLRLHFVNKLSGREIAANCGCGKSSVYEFLRRFKDCRELSYPLSEDVTNEYIGELLYKKPGTPVEKQLYRSFDEEAVHKALSRKGETLIRQWRKYDAVGIVDGKRPLSYRQYCSRYSEWAESQMIAVKDFLLISIGKAGGMKLLRKAFAADEYDEEELHYVGNVLQHMSAKTIWRTFESCNNYKMPQPITTDCGHIEY